MPDTTDPVNLTRFTTAQEPLYPQVLAELRSGQKTGHWMWFIFPQIQGLGHSEMSRHYAVTSVDEAKAYLAHPILGARLKECTHLVLQIEGRSLKQIFGEVDALKFHSSMTLFAHATPAHSDFTEAITRYCGGSLDAPTLNQLD
ncbi:MAG: DUF1810 domain-containing protein [Acidobacteriaceae bacterium]